MKGAERCTCGKVRFASREEAEKRLEQLAGAKERGKRPTHGRGGTRAKRPVRAYECALFGGWHLSSRARFGAEDA